MLVQKIRAWAFSVVEDHSSCLYLAKTGAFVINEGDVNVDVENAIDMPETEVN